MKICRTTSTDIEEIKEGCIVSDRRRKTAESQCVVTIAQTSNVKFILAAPDSLGEFVSPRAYIYLSLFLADSQRCPSALDNRSVTVTVRFTKTNVTERKNAPFLVASRQRKDDETKRGFDEKSI